MAMASAEVPAITYIGSRMTMLMNGTSRKPPPTPSADDTAAIPRPVTNGSSGLNENRSLPKANTMRRNEATTQRTPCAHRSPPSFTWYSNDSAARMARVSSALALLERKPNSLDFGKPFEQWDLPQGFATLRRRLESESGGEGRREFIKVLRLLESHSAVELGKAIHRALDIGALTVDVIRILGHVSEGDSSKFIARTAVAEGNVRIVPQPV